MAVNKSKNPSAPLYLNGLNLNSLYARLIQNICIKYTVKEHSDTILIIFEGALSLVLVDAILKIQTEYIKIKGEEYAENASVSYICIPCIYDNAKIKVTHIPTKRIQVF